MPYILRLGTMLERHGGTDRDVSQTSRHGRDSRPSQYSNLAAVTLRSLRRSVVAPAPSKCLPESVAAINDRCVEDIRPCSVVLSSFPPDTRLQWCDCLHSASFLIAQTASHLRVSASCHAISGSRTVSNASAVKDVQKDLTPLAPDARRATTRQVRTVLACTDLPSPVARPKRVIYYKSVLCRPMPSRASSPAAATAALCPHFVERSSTLGLPIPF
ncbi:hypothetical protein C8Q74DRAFT_465853 [Fomes fomentarius]|nr:hypothetical protein C8Q74DRAFT_465853 [Fomes fomentarius]